MNNVFIIRIDESEYGTRSILITPGFECCVLELPWLDNKPNISCISTGEYIAKIRISRRFGECYWITNVKGRSWILTHSGNLAGMTSKGLITHTHGCLLLGKKWGWLRKQRAVLISRPTVTAFKKHMKKEPFNLKIYSYREAA